MNPQTLQTAYTRLTTEVSATDIQRSITEQLRLLSCNALQLEIVYDEQYVNVLWLLNDFFTEVHTPLKHPHDNE